jgi:hypothetical protein
MEKMWLLSGLLLGILLGVVLHRGDFCMHSAIRESLARRPGPSTRAWLLALAIQLLVVNGLASLGWLLVPIPPVSILAGALGGLVFGFGMVMAKG